MKAIIKLSKFTRQSFVNVPYIKFYLHQSFVLCGRKKDVFPCSLDTKQIIKILYLYKSLSVIVFVDDEQSTKR